MYFTIGTIFCVIMTFFNLFKDRDGAALIWCIAAIIFFGQSIGG